MFKNNPYIICEVGSNWTSLQDCLDSIIQAKLAGADAVKFQLYSSMALYGINPPELFTKGSMNPFWIPQLAAQCERVGIDFMCSTFSPELIDVIDRFVRVHKVASSEMCHVRMLEKLKKIGKPVILSTGAQTASDIKMAIDCLGEIKNNQLYRMPLTLMYCVSSYPANDIDLSIIELMREEFYIDSIGFSDHSLDYLNLPMIAAKLYGCSVIEKHFTAIDAETPDSGHSLNPDQFKKMVDKIKGEYKSVIGPTPSEKDMILKHKRRLVAIRDISKGQVLSEGHNFGIYRSLVPDSRGLTPFAVNFVEGKVCKSDIKAGGTIGPGDI